jgi:hypothetical protein
MCVLFIKSSCELFAIFDLKEELKNYPNGMMLKIEINKFLRMIS